MKLLSTFIGALVAGNTEWPASSFEQTCGAVAELPMASNQTCVVSLDKGVSAWVNAGGSFVTEASTENTKFYIHSYDGHGESNNGYVRFLSHYMIPYVWPGSMKPGKVPAPWQLACGSADDISISCTDNGGEVEGIFLTPFNFSPGQNEGVRVTGIKNTAGHNENSFYNIKLKNRKMEGIAIKNIEVDFMNATVLATEGADGSMFSASGEFGIMLSADYNGELLPVRFEQDGVSTFFGGAQAFYSTIN